MKTRYRLIRRGTRGGMFYCVDTKTGKRTSLQTANEDEARQLMESRNNADRQPAMNLQIAQVYLQHGDPALSARTWQNVMEQIIANTGQSQPERQVKSSLPCFFTTSASRRMRPRWSVCRSFLLSA